MARFYFTSDAIRYRDTTRDNGYGLYFEGLGGYVFNLSNQTWRPCSVRIGKQPSWTAVIFMQLVTSGPFRF